MLFIPITKIVFTFVYCNNYTIIKSAIMLGMLYGSDSLLWVRAKFVCLSREPLWHSKWHDNQTYELLLRTYADITFLCQTQMFPPMHSNSVLFQHKRYTETLNHVSRGNSCADISSNLDRKDSIHTIKSLTEIRVSCEHSSSNNS